MTTTQSVQSVLLGKSLPELTEWIEGTGQPTYRGKQLYQWLYQKGVHNLQEITVFPKAWRAEMQDYPVGRSQIHHHKTAPDGTRKYLLKLHDGLIIETVGIPTEKRLTVCVSSQVGCAMACEFCATGKMGFTRHLQAYEILDQVLTVQEDFRQRVSHVVFMGMGEPLANIEEVIKAVHSLNKDIGIGQRSLTISTVGVPDKIRALAEEHLQVTFAVSLHAPNQDLRETLIPTAKHYPIHDLLDECREYVDITRRRLSFEYILLAGVNDLPEHATELAKHLRGFQSHVNLIPYNPISEEEFKRPGKKRINVFKQILQDHKIAVSVRYSKGLEADAACGQLRTNLIKKVEVDHAQPLQKMTK
ncbi:23S rRNA (adenine(2503)-C(2))-methyltransferase RlmN [[Limnothrix rosea] IAM M-220]|uniref:23S rRNA (adenine(2503)-C(2))-methyltransferase RlmN n=1 Tax=[Limnothrix rosea] IAM M-220 TaxID=454133 RepID=UPI00095CADE1|nr:23S rRNA (adenine(2503)-C(2))-methyltransferase RlmN [[Limnothrix rosea] IAM M-220]OKH11241.1 23S rRNA (adenine(2503)-C(2))-methyltransferase [[Limnothrix rosea] IAM M-220]